MRTERRTRTVNIKAIGESYRAWRQSNDVLARIPGLATVAKLDVDRFLDMIV